MRRALPVLAITAIGVGALAAFHSSTPASGNLAARPPASTAPPATAPPPTSGTPPTPGTTAPTAPPTSQSSNTAKATYTGEAVDNRYGTVQVRVTVQAKKIVAVDALQLPNDRERSAYISEQAGPMLQQEVLQAQNAQIDIVSGATYTSESYAQSLQSALDKAHI